MRLLTRMKRSVGPTEGGDRSVRTVAPRFEEIELETAALRELRDKPAGTIRTMPYATDAPHRAYLRFRAQQRQTGAPGLETAITSVDGED